jgi:threonyl-tRNA synthetase
MSKAGALASSDAETGTINLAGERYVPAGYDRGLYKIRHSAAHVLAQAIKEHFKENGAVLFGIGPPIEDGFYYDFVLPRALSDEELPRIEERMKSIVRAAHPFEAWEIDADRARSMFAGQSFKLELIEGLLRGAVDDNGNPLPGQQHAPITVFRQGDFIDLCRGPHVGSTSDLDPDALKLLNTSGVYWRGKPDNPRMTRVYGTAWRNKDELAQYEWRRAEAEKRDHRR